MIAAGQEERFSRKRHDSGFPHLAIQYVLHEAGIKAEDLDAVGFYDKPLLKFERMLSTYVATFPRSFASFRKAIPVWLHEKLWVPSIIRKELKPYAGPILFAEHHMSHAASCFLPSPFEEAAILTVDGVGEWATASFGVGRGSDITLFKEIRFPHSLGLLYSAFTYYLGFKVNSAEYKVMGLAPYGKPVHFERIMKEMVQLNEDGSFKLNMKYFSYDHGLRMTNGAFDEFFGGPPRKPETWMTEREFDIAASVQKVCEEVVLEMVRHLHQETGLDAAVHGRRRRAQLRRQRSRDPRNADEAALGAARGGRRRRRRGCRPLHLQHAPQAPARRRAGRTPTWARSSATPRSRASWTGPGRSTRRCRDAELVARTAQLISESNVIGWFQGRMEFGPRALGGRSILADPRDPKMRDTLNMKIKFREGFRPFAPSVLMDKATEWFEIDCDSPYMLLVAQVREGRRTIPSVTHVDNSARLQTVTRAEAPLYYDLIREFERLTGVPIVINTSFNVRGEPIVCTPKDAYLCFMRTDMDTLVLGHHILDKKRQPPLEGRRGLAQPVRAGLSR